MTVGCNTKYHYICVLWLGYRLYPSPIRRFLIQQCNCYLIPKSRSIQVSYMRNESIPCRFDGSYISDHLKFYVTSLVTVSISDVHNFDLSFAKLSFVILSSGRKHIQHVCLFQSIVKDSCEWKLMELNCKNRIRLQFISLRNRTHIAFCCAAKIYLH